MGGRGSKGREVGGGVRGGTPPPPTVNGRSNASLGGGGSTSGGTHTPNYPPPLAKSRGSARRSPGWGGETVTK